MTSDDCRFCCTNARPMQQGESRRVFLLEAAAAAGGLLAAPRRAAAAESGEAAPLFAYIGCSQAPGAPWGLKGKERRGTRGPRWDWEVNDRALYSKPRASIAMPALVRVAVRHSCRAFAAFISQPPIVSMPQGAGRARVSPRSALTATTPGGTHMVTAATCRDPWPTAPVIGVRWRLRRRAPFRLETRQALCPPHPVQPGSMNDRRRFRAKQ
jgi:hypothetical protein